MRTIYSAYRTPVIASLEPVGESETVQGIVTSLSVILNSGKDDNNMRLQELGYSGDNVVDLYPEVFNRPTKYEMDYLQQQQVEHEPGGPSDVPPDQPAPTPPAGSPSDLASAETVSEK